MKHTKRIFLLSLAIITGFGGIAATALAQGDSIVTLCYRGRTIRVPLYLQNRYLAKPGTTQGACPVTPP